MTPPARALGLLLLTTPWPRPEGAGVPAQEPTRPIGDPPTLYMCPPCSPDCHAARYESTGNCAGCGMPLVPVEEVTHVALLLYTGCDLFDWTAAASIFQAAGEFYVFTVADSTDPLRCGGLVEVFPSYSFEQAPRADVLVVAGGGGVREILSDELHLDWLRAAAGRAEHVLGLGTATYLLGAADLLEEKPATTQPESARYWPELALGLELRLDERIVEADGVLTTRDAFAGLEAALRVVREQAGEEAAQRAGTRLGLVAGALPR